MSATGQKASDQQALAAALGRIPSGLFILTVRHGSAETGMLTSWVQQCSFDPPQVSVAIRRDRAVSGWLVDGAVLTLNIIAEGHRGLVAHFGKGFDAGEPAFTGLEVERPAGEAPVLAEALAYLHCRVAGRCPAGDHDLVIARVVSGRVQGEGRPTVHIRKSGLNY